VKSQNVKLNAQIRDVKCLTALNVLPSVKLLTVLLIVKLLSPNVRLFAKNQNVTGNATNQTAQNPSANLSVKILTVFLKLNAVLALWEELELPLLSPSLRKLLTIKNAVHAINNSIINANFRINSI
jgi:hypothetical protein